MIVSSFLSQYGIRLSREAGGMQWTEFCDLLAGLSPDTALMRMVAIRSEENQEALKNFTPEQRRIRSQWRTKAASKKSTQEVGSFLAQMQAVFAKMSGQNGGESR